MILLPSRAPELNPVENIWQYLRQTWLSNRVFDTYEEIIDAACDAWRRLIASPEPSHPSARANGPWQVKDEGLWYHTEGRGQQAARRSMHDWAVARKIQPLTSL